MTFKEMKNFINQKRGSGEPSWQQTIFNDLFEKFSVIPLVKGVYSASDEEGIKAERQVQDKKAAAIKDWARFCHTRNTEKPIGCDKLGICCGPASGILVVDVDAPEAFGAFCTTNGISTSFDTLTVATSNGRYHLYFKYPNDGHEYKSRSQGNAGCGFDIRGIGGYVIAPGSIHPVTKQYYTIKNASYIADAPQLVLEWSLNRTLPQGSPPAQTPLIPSQGSLEEKLGGLPQELRQRISTSFPVGSRSEASISVMESLISNGFSKNEILDVYLKFPIGEKLREKGIDWFNHEFDKASAYVASIATKKIDKNKNLDMASELFSTIKEFTYYSNEGKYYCKVSTNAGVRFLDIESMDFSGMIFSRQAEKTTITGTTQQMKIALSRLKYHALEHARPIEKVCRFGQSGEKLLLNLGRASGECIQITELGYSLIPQPDILMLRDAETSPIEELEMGCHGMKACDEMLALLGITNEYDRHYLKITMVSWLFAQVATPILFFIGNPGSGKTTLATALKGVFDPTDKGGAYLPETILEMALVLSKAGIAYIDNFTNLNKKIQNALCLAFSKGYYSKKKNYTDTETVNISMQCPVILSALTVPESLQSDLFSRMAFFTVENKEKLIADSDMDSRLGALYPKVRGELCWMASEILKRINSFSAIGIKRHGDFDKLGQAYCSIFLGNEKIYTQIMKYRCTVDALARLQTNPAISSFIHLVQNKNMTIMTMTDLYSEISSHYGQSIVNGKTPASLSKELQSCTSLLNAIGISIFEGGKVNCGRVYMFVTDEYFYDSSSVTKEYLRLNPSYITSIYHRNHIDQIVDTANTESTLNIQ